MDKWEPKWKIMEIHCLENRGMYFRLQNGEAEITHLIYDLDMFSYRLSPPGPKNGRFVQSHLFQI